MPAGVEGDDPAEVPLDRDGEAVIKRRGDWSGDGYIPIPYEGDVFGPWTVLHIPKEADQ